MDQEALMEKIINNGEGKGKRRKRTAVEKIDDKRSLQVTFTKRRKGLFKKAEELSILCGVEVAVIAFSPAGKAFTFGDVGSAMDRLSATLNDDDRADQKKKKKKKKMAKKDENGMEIREDRHNACGLIMEEPGQSSWMMGDDELDEWLKNLAENEAWADSCFAN